jgi:hypothetical protein
MNLQETIRRILREEFLNEGNIKVPRSEIDKAGVLLDLINSDIEKYKNNKTTLDNASIDFKNYFKIKDENGEPNYISVGIYNDDKDVGAARMDVNNNNLLINVHSWDGMSLENFEDIITHELVHSMDKLLKNSEVFNDYYSKKGAEPTGNKFNLSKVKNSKSEYSKNYEKYRKSQHEYNAELTPLINKIKKIVKNDEYKIKLMFWLIENAKNYNNETDLYHDTKDYFTDGSGRMFNSQDDYWKFIYNMFAVIKPWTTKPTLYKKFINDLYLGINK